MLAQSLQCPECGSTRVWKAGLRYTNFGEIQRYVCRDCGFRFSDPEFSRKITNSSYDKQGSRQICVPLTEGMKNLVKVETRTKNALRESAQEQKGELVAFGWHMKTRGLSDATIKQRMYRLNVLVKKGANLEDPETVETILATSEWRPANKKIFANCYKAYTTYKKIEWQKPKITVPQKEPFLPLEEEVHQLIAGCGKKTSTLLQLLFETGCRIGEAALLQWQNIDFKSRNLKINCPEKGGNARTIQLSQELLAMLKALPKREDIHIFNPNVRTLSSTFARQRNRLARQLQNPRFKQIHFHTLRHLRATLTYYKTSGDILKVKYLLGHKRLDTTGRYAHYQAFRNEEYVVKRVNMRKEEDQLIEDGFQFVRYDQKHEEAVYRKRK